MVMYFTLRWRGYIVTWVALVKVGLVMGLIVRLSATLLECLVCVICNSKNFHSFLFKLCIIIVHILKICTSYLESELISIGAG